MKKFLLLMVLLGQALCSFAQDAPKPTAPVPSVAPSKPSFVSSKKDTIQAIRNMYERHRRAGKIWLGVATGGGLALLRVATARPVNNTSYGPTTTSDNSGALAVVGGVFCGLPLIIAVTKLAGTSEEVEEKQVQSYSQTGKIPDNIVKQVKSKDFH